MAHSFPTRRSSELKRNGPFIFPPARLEVAWLHIFSSANTPEAERQTSTALSSTVKARFPFSGTSSSRHKRTRAMVSLRKSSKDEAYHRSEEHTSELQSLMRISYAVFCLKKKNSSHSLLTALSNTSYTAINSLNSKTVTNTF